MDINFNMLTIKIKDIGEDGCKLVSEINENSNINYVSIDDRIHDPIAVKIILSAIQGTRVEQVRFRNNLLCSDGAKYLAEGLKETNISHLVIGDDALQSAALEYLPDILKGNCITELDVIIFENTDTYLYNLAKGLKNSSIFNLRVLHTVHRTDLLKYLVDVLPETNITQVILNKYVDISEIRDLPPYWKLYQDRKFLLDDGEEDDGYTESCFEQPSREEVEYLAKLLKNSCITHFKIDSPIKDNVLEILIRALEDTTTQIIQIPYIGSSKFEKVTSKNKVFAKEIKNAFKKLVKENTENNNMEFIIPNETDNLNIGAYLDFIKTITNNPNVKGHIFDLMRSFGYISSNRMRKINEFIKTISDKFNAFFNNKLINLHDDFNYIDLVKQCEDMGLYDIVKNLLLHRHLYYVDDGQEILHPFIYKMLNKYGMTLYMEQIEPKKKNDIICYYQSHPEIEGAQEVLDLLQSQYL